MTHKSMRSHAVAFFAMRSYAENAISKTKTKSKPKSKTRIKTKSMHPHICGESEPNMEKFVTRQETGRKTVERLGLDIKPASEVIHRSDYETEEEYIDACVAYRQKMSDPAYRSERKKVIAEISEEETRKQRAQQKAKFADDVKAVTLTEDEKSRAGSRATERAKQDLTHGKISVTEYADKVLQYTADEEKAAKAERVTNVTMNEWIRGARNYAAVNGGEADGAGYAVGV